MLGSVTASAKPIATAASTALPPSARTRAPAAAASGVAAAATPARLSASCADGSVMRAAVAGGTAAGPAGPVAGVRADEHAANATSRIDVERERIEMVMSRKLTYAGRSRVKYCGAAFKE